MKKIRDSVARDQLMILPPSVEDYVSKDDSVRVINKILDDMNLDYLLSSCKGGGAPSYDPRILMKVLIYGYSQGLVSSRKLDYILHNDVRYMYIAQMNRPDFRTICRFRRGLELEIKRVFTYIVRMCMECGLVLLEHVSLDGTKIEANVSGKNTFKKERLDNELECINKKITSILEQAEKEDIEEDKLYGDTRVNELPQALKNAENRKKLLEAAQKKLEESDRETICVTDPESRVMKTRAGNRPAYNAQAVVDKEHQIIVAADITQDESDNYQLPVMLEELESVTGKKPECVTVDGGYNSKKALEYIEENDLNVYMPIYTNSAESKGFKYDESSDEYICPCNMRLTFRSTRNKYDNTYRIYRHSCSDCPMRKVCCGDKNRVKEVWRRVNDELQQKMLAKMQTESAKQAYRWRKQIVEPVHADIKFNKGLWRFLLKGKDGARIEYLLGCIGHNLRKIIRYAPKEVLGTV